VEIEKFSLTVFVKAGRYIGGIWEWVRMLGFDYGAAEKIQEKDKERKKKRKKKSTFTQFKF
jgi:hypothetical protein